MRNENASMSGLGYQAKTQAQNLQAGQPNAPESILVSLINRQAENLNLLGSLVGRLTVLNERIFTPMPSKVDGTKVPNPPPGALSSLECLTMQTQDMAVLLSEQVSRLEML
jgi:hypothetical protein